MNKRMIFHIPFQPDPNRASASQIRPFKMMTAFSNLGYQVEVVMGYAKERKNQIKTIKQNIKNGVKYDFLYSESSTMPTMLTESHHLPSSPCVDFDFFRYCKRSRISIGLFYRDIHWKFEHYKANISSFKRSFANVFYRLDLRYYKRLIDVLYLPSTEMKKFIPELSVVKTIALPPGLDLVKIDSRPSDGTLKILYVGGLSDLYDLRLFLKAIVELNNLKVYFTICCREDDYQKVQSGYLEFLNFKNIKIVHNKGKQLVQLYRDHDVCCLFTRPTEYWDFAMPVKLFEYLAFHKPIVAVKGTAVGYFVQSNKMGWALNYNLDEIKDWICNLAHDHLNQQRVSFEQKVLQHTWEERAKLVVQSLSKL